MPSLPLKMHQNVFDSRALLEPAGGAHSALPDPLAGLRGPTLRGREGNAPNLVCRFGGIEPLDPLISVDL